ncbi:MAG: NTP transferase domain-containing protein [Parcubacteria group bacterium]|nr:NTP transferase domain-containing protein [Parcubacteria group bacterium]
MKGVILAGGKATRLYPLTLVTNKHLLPVYNKPVIYYAIDKLVSAGVDRIMIVTSPHHVNDFVNLLGSGHDFRSKNNGKQIQIVYGIQDKPSGIADGLYIAKDYIGDENCILYLGDNILEDDISTQVKNFKDGSVIFLKKVKDPERFGVATLDKKGSVLNIEEKPKKPKSDLAVVGIYMYDNTVFKKMIGQPVSKRGEYEITYINNMYIKDRKLKGVPLKKDWFDIGTFESLIEASNYMKKKHGKNKS